MLRNDPTRAGQRANKPETFGEFNRYAVFAVHTRDLTEFGIPNEVAWCVADAEEWDEETDRPAIIRIERTKMQAVEGLK